MKRFSLIVGLVGCLGICGAVAAVPIQLDLFAYRQAGSIWKFDVGAGIATKIADDNIFASAHEIEFAPTSVPEPTTLALMALGMAGIGYSRRKHKTLLAAGKYSSYFAG